MNATPMNATPMNATPMNATRQDSDPPDPVPWARGLPSWAPRDPAALAALPTARAWWRGRRLAEGDHPSRRVVEWLEELASASGTHPLRVYPPKALRGRMGRMAGLAPRAGAVCKRLGHLLDHLVAPLVEEARALAEQRLLTPLPALVTPRPPLRARARQLPTDQLPTDQLPTDQLPTRLGMAGGAHLAARVHRRAPRAEDLLRALSRAATRAPLRPALPARRARPDPSTTPKALTARRALLVAHEVSPPPRRLLSAGGEEGPLRGRAWAPRHRSRRRAQPPRQRADGQSTQGKRAIPPTSEGGSTLALSW
jgi:hypothetical protein